MKILELLLKGVDDKGTLDAFFVSAAKNAVQRMADGDEALDMDVRDRRLNGLLDACVSCRLDSSQSFAIASFLWKGTISLLGRSDAAAVAVRALGLMCSAAEKVLLQSIRATVSVETSFRLAGFRSVALGLRLNHLDPLRCFEDREW